MNLRIKMPNGQIFQLNRQDAVDCAMKEICLEKGWESYFGVAKIQQSRMEKHDIVLMDELLKCDWETIYRSLEPKLVYASRAALDIDRDLWAKERMEVKFVKEPSTVEVYGY